MKQPTYTPVPGAVSGPQDDAGSQRTCRESTGCAFSLGRPDEDVALVKARGEIDHHTSPAFREVVSRALMNGPRHLIVDLTDVTHVDASALAVLVGAAGDLGIWNGRLEVVCPARLSVCSSW